MPTLNEYVVIAENMETKKRDFTNPAFYFNPDGSARINGVGEYAVSDWALSQMCGRFGPLVYGSGSRRSVPADLMGILLRDERFVNSAAGLLNDMLDAGKAANQTRFVRLYEDRVRAFLSERYAAISNLEILRTAQKGIDLLAQRPDGESVIVSPYHSALTPDRMDLRFVLRQFGTDDGTYGIGAYLYNDEIGKHRIKVLPLIQRTSCLNSLVVNSEDAGESLDATHRGAQTLLADRVAVAVGHALKIGVEATRKLLMARQVKVENFFGVIDRMAEEEGWTKEERSAFWVGTESNQSAFGIINGLTYVAHNVHGDDQEKMYAWQSRAGERLYQYVPTTEAA